MAGVSHLRLVYLGLAFWGAVHPMLYFVKWFAENGLSLGGLIEAWHVNAATSGLAWDLTIAAISLTVWIVVEVAVRRNWVALLAIPVTFGIGLACGLPLYLFLRSAPVR